jgi:hypothetical protein
VAVEFAALFDLVSVAGESVMIGLIVVESLVFLVPREGLKHDPMIGMGVQGSIWSFCHAFPERFVEALLVNLHVDMV